MPMLVEQLSEEGQKSEVKLRPSPVVHFDFEVDGLKGPVVNVKNVFLSEFTTVGIPTTI